MLQKCSDEGVTGTKACGEAQKKPLSDFYGDLRARLTVKAQDGAIETT